MRGLFALVALSMLAAPPAEAASLTLPGPYLGPPSRIARQQGYTFADTGSDIEQLVAEGVFVPVSGTGNVHFEKVSYPFALPVVARLVAELGRGHMERCGEPLVVTSLARPRRHQPRNASRRSVHPAGMAVDLRRPWHLDCRRWLEARLSQLESIRVLEMVPESNPIHFHVAVFPHRLAAYLDQLDRQPRRPIHLVTRGEALWRIARRHHTTVEALRAVNNLRSDRLSVGQELLLPTAELAAGSPPPEPRPGARPVAASAP